LNPGKKLVVGIDEAGRGPIVGPLVMAAVAAPREVFEEFHAMGVRDSKELSPRARMRLAEEIERSATVVVVVKHPPALIDAVNLNTMEHDTMLYMLQRIGLRGRIAEVYVDAVGPPRKTLSLLARTFPDARIIVEPKADARYTPVAAASIVAKVARDAEIERYRSLYGLRGSGYPTDPETLDWIREVYQANPGEPPPIVRRTWGTLKRLAPAWYRPKQRSSAGDRGGRRQRSLLDYLKSRRGDD